MGKNKQPGLGKSHVAQGNGLPAVNEVTFHMETRQEVQNLGSPG